MSDSKITFYGIELSSGKMVSGYYWENDGVGYIIEKDETKQPPIRRTHAVDPEAVMWEFDSGEDRDYEKSNHSNR